MKDSPEARSAGGTSPSPKAEMQGGEMDEALVELLACDDDSEIGGLKDEWSYDAANRSKRLQSAILKAHAAIRALKEKPHG